MIKLSRISLILLLMLSISAVTLAAGNIYKVVNDDGKEIVIYPNPVLGNKFNVKSNQEITAITVLNVLGQKVYTREFVHVKTVNIELETCDRGIYLVQLRTIEGITITKRILLK